MLQLNNSYNVLYVELVLEASHKGSLDKVISHQHITLSFNPDDDQVKAFMPLVGKTYNYTVVGYANNGMNEGYACEISEEIPYFNQAMPHITLSLSEGAKAVDTGYLQFNAFSDNEKFSGKATLNFFMANTKPEA